MSGQVPGQVPWQVPRETAQASGQAPRQSSGRERRRERRYQVSLPATLRFEDEAHAVQVSDLSASGALVSVEAADELFWSGDEVVLELDQFGPIEARVAHAGSNFCGIQFTHPHQHRDALAAWLQSEASPA